VLGIEALLLEYRLDAPEGIALMCLAEALLRIPDPAIADALIHDLLSPITWQNHLGHSEDFFVNAASWGLALTGRWLHASEHPQAQPQHWITRIAARVGENVLRHALQQAMRFLAGQFVLGENLGTALHRAQKDWQRGYTHSFDMLGEAALTTADSARYFNAYRNAIAQVGQWQLPTNVLRPNISIKLSALHPRYQTAQKELLQRELIPELIALCKLASAQKIDLTIDAEESDRLELSLELFAQLIAQLDATERENLGLVVQAYNQRALSTLQWLHDLAATYALRIKVRLVKGAYWDSEIKLAQQRGLSAYPVFTDKAATDLSYLACAQYLLQHPQQFYPQFATHNAASIAAILQMVTSNQDFEFQRLQGMGEALYDCVREQYPTLRCRIYAPIGDHRELLPYLVRRLLENGANTSFIHQLFDSNVPIETLSRHPLNADFSTARLTMPSDLFQPERGNSPGINWHLIEERELLFSEIRQYIEKQTVINVEPKTENSVTVINPATLAKLGSWLPATSTQLNTAITTAKVAQRKWENETVDSRAKIIEVFADNLISERAALIALIVQETGKTLENAFDEIREAVDFCRYYATQARKIMATPTQLPGPVGEHNQLWLRPRGVFACISPWNFPLAIFVGQIAAALVTGNTVIAKPAEQSTLTACFATTLLHAAGVPAEVLHLVPGFGEIVGAELCAHPNIDGVVFTGGFDTARAIQRQLAARGNQQNQAAIIPFIAETAGLNCLIADSSAQPQQLVLDVMRSAFDSAGQRCSALRVLYLPESCAENIEALLIGAMQTRHLGDPLDWSTDIGPVIDVTAQQLLLEHIELFRTRGQLLFQTQAPKLGLFIPLTLIRLTRLNELTREAFGPILHIIRYSDNDVDTVVDEINQSGFGLTCGLHSRNLQRAQTLARRLRVGNCYINRDMIGAVVGVQPFGGNGKSGTGPKAGGPHYLHRFVMEQTITINTSAIGGDAHLLAGPSVT